jgi:deazaflavin-dependent oxidoreductase (nitroreductase family)
MHPSPHDASEAMSQTRAVAIIRWIGLPVMTRLGLVGVLEVAGRRTGRIRRVSLAPVEVDGTRYLLSMYGTTHWVRNLRAAGRGTLRRRGHTDAITAVEVRGTERARVIAAFHAQAPKPFRQDFDRRPGAVDHPAFRVELSAEQTVAAE